MHLTGDLRFAIRSLRSRPGFAAVAILSLGLGIGAAATVFTLVDALVLSPLPFPEAHELTLLDETDGNFNSSVAYLNFLDWREQTTAFEAMAAGRTESRNLTGGDQPMRVNELQVSPDLFPALGATPALGRFYSEQDDRSGAEPVAVLSYALWSDRFGQDPAVLNRSITLDGRAHTVIGVAPPATLVWGEIDVYTPLGLQADRFQDRGSHPGIYVVARMKDGVGLEAARADMDVIARRLEQQYPDSNTNDRVRVRPLQELYSGDYRRPGFILLAGVGFLMLIVCANIANLLLSRAAGRRGELAVRGALGAGRGQLLRQLLTESLVLAAAGAALGVALAQLGVQTMIAALPNEERLADVSVDMTALAFIAAVAVGSALLFGLAPAWSASRVQLTDALREASRGGQAGGQGFRKALIVGELALAQILLVGAALMMQSFWNVVDTNPGFNPDNLLITRLNLPREEYPQERINSFADELRRRAEALPGVRGAGLAAPLLGGWQRSVLPEGAPPPQPGQYTPVDVTFVTPGYMETMELELIAGRYFAESDTENVVAVDETYASKYWPNEDPIGKRVVFGSPQDGGPWMTVVGVVSHVKNYGVDEESRIEVYGLLRDFTINTPVLLMRTENEPTALASAVRAVVAELDPNLPVYGVRSMEDLLGERVAQRRLTASIMFFFALSALALAILGVYGVMSYNVTQRSREIGLRMAVGADPGQVRGWIVGQAMTLFALGAVIGLGGAYLLSSYLQSVVFNVSTTDALSYAGVLTLLGLAAMAAAWLPAARAAAADPLEALRLE